jgi:DNA-binding NarL/FixJ family response regulator
MKRSPTNNRDSENGDLIQLSPGTLLRLEELRHRNGHTTLDAVIGEAADLYARLKTDREMTSYENLSPRLREVLRMIADGHSTKEIATQLQVSKKTVEFHRAQLVKKLGIRAVALLARYAVRVGAVLP